MVTRKEEMMREVTARNVKTGKKVFYKSLSEVARLYNVSVNVIWKRIFFHKVVNDVELCYNDGNVKSNPDLRLKADKGGKKAFLKKDKVLDATHDLRPFEMISGVVCITPCKRKYKPDGSDIFIGSAACQHCVSYRGINRKEMKVACAFKYIQQE